MTLLEDLSMDDVDHHAATGWHTLDFRALDRRETRLMARISRRISLTVLQLPDKASLILTSWTLRSSAR